jgi:hypothetical protein
MAQSTTLKPHYNPEAIPFHFLQPRHLYTLYGKRRSRGEEFSPLLDGNLRCRLS